MRPDFGKCVIERPRRNSSSPNKHTRERIDARNWERYEDAGRDHGIRRPMSMGNPKSAMATNYKEAGYGKEFTDLLGPLNKYLHKSVGRPVNECRSELRQVLGGSEPMLHILTVHFEDRFRVTNPNYEPTGFYEDPHGRVQYRKHVIEYTAEEKANIEKRVKEFKVRQSESEAKRHKPETCPKCAEALKEHNRVKKLEIA